VYRSIVSALALTAFSFVHPSTALGQAPAATSDGLVRAQSSGPQQTPTQIDDAAERTLKRFRAGVVGGVGLDPESLLFGAHATVGPFFSRYLDLRPGIEAGVGEITTLLGINVDVMYRLPGIGTGATWTPYVGIGPNFALSHRGFDGDDEDDIDDRNRFDFSDTDFEGGVNFLAGVRRRNGMFLEMKATAYGVSNVRLLVGYDF
jgi:hypothetical protein